MKAKFRITNKNKIKKYLTVFKVSTKILRIVFSKTNQLLEKYIILIILMTLIPLSTLLT